MLGSEFFKGGLDLDPLPPTPSLNPADNDVSIKANKAHATAEEERVFFNFVRNNHLDHTFYDMKCEDY